MLLSEKENLNETESGYTRDGNNSYIDEESPFHNDEDNIVLGTYLTIYNLRHLILFHIGYSTEKTHLFCRKLKPARK